jgi:alginate O-acetyltransferase complex protein AlgI
MHALLDRGYRWIAAHRGCGHVSCNPNTRGRRSHRLKKTAGPSRTGHWREALLEIWPAWIALMGLPISVLPLRDHLASWQFMWLMAAAIFFGCKWLTAWRALRRKTDAPITRTLGYFFAWPGMDAEKFLSRRSQNLTALSRQVYETPSLARSEVENPACELPSVDELSGNMPDRASRMAALPFFSAIAKAFLGLVLLFGVAPFAQQPLLTGWMGMIGLILILHFGLFQLLAAGWHKAGIDVEPIMNEPLRSKSVSEFWGRRWNSAFNRLALELIFRPTIRRLRGRSCCYAAEGSRGSSTLRLNRGTMIATLAAFLVSGLIHELVISLPARAGYGLPTAYFLLQGIGILAERAFPQIRGHTFTALITALPAFCLFHPPFVHNVILPFMKTIGAL